MKYKTSTGSLLALFAVCLSTPRSIAEDWVEVLSEDFSKKTELDSSTWGFERGFVRGAEPQYYVDKFGETVYIRNSHLVIASKRGDMSQLSLIPHDALSPQGRTEKYVSGSIFTKNSWQCLRVEVIAQLPSGPGIFPAIWLRGQDKRSYSEIDIVEYFWKTNKFGTTIHYGPDQSHLSRAGRSDDCSVCSKAFQKYIAEIDNNTVTIMRNDTIITHLNIKDLNPDQQRIFKQPYRLKLNLALSGEYPWSTSEGEGEAEMLVKSVRLWQKPCAK